MKTISEIEMEIWQLECQKKELRKREIDNQSEKWAMEILSNGWVSTEIVDRIVRSRITQFKFYCNIIPTRKDFQWNGLKFEYDWDDHSTWYNIRKVDGSVFTINQILEIEAYNNEFRGDIIGKLESKKDELKKEIEIINRLFLEILNIPK